ncbi:HNH endonuclease [Pseudoxanthomonas sp. SL93]|uniref:HNH endonuclease n=1 Tax=Pseudoxanthomonas sp. SL93 TaxID=2995142 RepID=UPI00226FFEE5|nr:HNH endonuclease [Pseudoxanthomonas sp. SL93]WAC61989.1 HNH endonuclease [Pseudoxanthomonas sp. SL93]
MKLKTLRERAFVRQQGRCYYCSARMWQISPEELGLHRKSSRLLQCTAEHLIARRDGGGDTCDNIVAACHYCNWLRHARRNAALAPEVYAARVRKRVARGTWHAPFAIFE